MNRELKTSTKLITYIIAVIIALYVLFPFYMVLINACKSSSKITESPVSLSGASFSQLMENLNGVIHNVHFKFWYAFGSSVFITVISLTLLALFGSMAAWVICRNKSVWSTVVYLAFITSMIIPFQAVMLSMISTFRDVGNFVGVPLLGSMQGTIFAYLGFGGAMTVFILHGFIKGIPYELEEAAEIDGCSPEQVFFRIIFPLLKPVIVTVTILNGMWIWNDYLLPFFILGSSSDYKTLPVAMQAFVGSFVTQWDLILAAALLTITPMIVLFLFAQKHIIAGMVDGAIK